MIASPRLSDLDPVSQRPGFPGGRPNLVSEVIEQAAARHPGREALVASDGRWTYEELNEAVAQVAAGLRELGCRKGDRLAVSGYNRGELAILFCAAMRMGAVWVGVPRALAPREKAQLLDDSASAIYLADPEYLDEVAGLDTPSRPEGFAALREIVDGLPTTSRQPDLDPHAPAAIAYTSGTTGSPKGAVHSQHNLLLPGAAGLGAPWSDRTRHGTALPITIINPMILGPLLAFQAGATSVIMDRIDAVGVARWIERERVNTLMAVPTMLLDLVNNDSVRPEQLTSLEWPIVGGADPPAALNERFAEKFGRAPLGCYGLSEAPSVVSMADPLDSEAEASTGRAAPHLSIVITDDDGRPLPAGTTGEVCIEPASEGEWAGTYTRFLGYLQNPNATSAATRGTQTRTGDIGHLDESGRLHISDRRNDLIIRGGANVYPAEVEAVLHRDARVSGCAVVGRPDERLGEVPIAFVEFLPGSEAKAAELRSLCEAQLARYKVPTEFVAVPALERNSMGKVVKGPLRELSRESVEALEEAR